MREKRPDETQTAFAIRLIEEAAADAAYRKAAEIVVRYGHISSDLARQKILAQCHTIENEQETD